MTDAEVELVKESWNALLAYCSWENLPPKLSAQVKAVAAILNRAAPVVVVERVSLERVLEFCRGPNDEEQAAVCELLRGLLK